MKTVHSLAQLQWHLAGSTPFLWQSPFFGDIHTFQGAEIPPIPTSVPGSVQQALRAAGVIPDWNLGNNYRLCEWVENRHWIYQTTLPGEWIEPGATLRLRCEGLDDRGWVYVNGQLAGEFKGSFTPHVFDLSGKIPAEGALLHIIFDNPPRWLGQFGYTSRITDWRPRYNYTWDWTARLVQIGIWDAISLEVTRDAEITSLRADPQLDEHGNGQLRLWGELAVPKRGKIRFRLSGPGIEKTVVLDAHAFNREGYVWKKLNPQPWMPNGMGEQPLYQLTAELLGRAEAVQDRKERTIGFKHMRWLPCQGAVPQADPWLAQINGQPVFLQGFNWTPIRPNFADVPESHYRELLTTYREMGCNILRVWGGSFLEKECFYRICDELGLLVWQDFPLSSSGIDNWPPEDLQSITELSEIVRSYITRRQHHVSLLCWCGGNELQGDLQGNPFGIGKPVDLSHPLIARFDEIVRAEDPQRRFLVTTSSGPRFSADARDFGKGLHWDVHGPWKPEGSLEAWKQYWAGMDSLFNSEVGAPGASPADLIAHYSGDLPLTPGTYDNPLWRRTLWWIEWPEFVRELGREPAELEEFVRWSQQRQAQALEIVVSSLKQRFPGCGGVILWMGHDSFPVTANTSVIDFAGRLKPAGEAVKKLFRRPTSSA